MTRFLFLLRGGLILTLVFLMLAVPAQAAIHHVRPGTRIADAVHAAAPGDLIRIHAGRYDEGSIVIDKPLRIHGRGTVVIDGGGTQGIFLVRADSVWIADLTLRNTGYSYTEDRAAVKATSARFCRFERLRLEDTFFGIYLARSARCIIRGNTLAGEARRESASGNGIHSWYSDSLLIADNHTARHRDGIYLEFTGASVIRGNVSTGNLRYGLHFMFSDDDVYLDNTFTRNGSGVAVMYSRRIGMRGNRFHDNWGSASYGLLLKDISDSRIDSNSFVGNTTGVYAEGGSRLTVTRNEFLRNGWAIRLMANCTGNTFATNSFRRNSFDVATNSTRNESWFTGNYWDSYRGYDIDRDGIGDVPYRPVRIFSYIVEKNPPAIILLNSFFIAMLDVTERIFPTVTPETLKDARPLMREPDGRGTPA